MEKISTLKKVCLASDNWSPAHPLIMEALIAANVGAASAYGGDAWTEQAEAVIQGAFRSPCKVFMVPTGTGANIFGLLLSCLRHESVICTNIAHIHYQESGAPEALIGCKLLTVPHQGGKITPEAIMEKLKSERAFGKHSTFPRVLAITEPTEVGTVYSLAELKTIKKLCTEENLYLHMDGSRLYNAAVSLGAPLHELVTAIGVDTLSLGGTKNGLLFAEALVVFNSELLKGAEHLQKQTLQLLSKMRYLSAQYIPFFTKKLWHTLAQNANLRAQEIASIIKATPGASLSYPVETNQVLFTVPASWIPLLQQAITCMVWDQQINQIRFIASWNTSEQDVRDVKAVFEKLKSLAK